MSKVLAIIPGRGGSKRIPRKNIKFFVNQPIIKYSIDAAFKSGLFDEVMVSTDDREIAQVSQKSGASVPFLRSEKTADDYAGLADVIEEVILEYAKSGKEFECFCCILATAPFVTAARLIQGFDLLQKTGADSVIPITKFNYPIQRAVKIENGQIKMFFPENYSKRSQDLIPAYHDAGQFYCMKTQSLLTQKKLYAENTIPLIIPESEVQDIDTLEDWKIAEFKYKMFSCMR